MSVNKAKKLIEKAIKELSATDMGIIVTQSTLEQVMEELNKLDWIPVEYGLPKSGEEVWVRIKDDENVYYNKLLRQDLSKVPNRQRSFYDKHGFMTAIGYGGCCVTHWKHIDKIDE